MLSTKSQLGVLFVLLSLCTLANSAVEERVIFDLPVGESRRLWLVYSEVVYFRFKVPEIKAGHDLSIIASPFGDSDPELFLSTKEQFPDEPDKSEYYSTSVGFSSIYVPTSKIVANKDYYLGVGCSSLFCDVVVSVDYSKEYFMRGNVEFFEIDSQGSIIARVAVDGTSDATHIVFDAEIENLQDVDQGIHMYVNKGNEIPTIMKHDINSTVAWGDGRAAYVYKGDPLFCTNCNYTVVIEAPKKSKVYFRRTVYGDKIATRLNSERDDAVEKDKMVTYAVNISALNVSSSIVVVEVSPYYGNPDVYANIETLPGKKEDYKFSAKSFGQELLKIPIDKKPANNLLYVSVYGKDASTYTIEFYENDKKNLQINLGDLEYGEVVGRNVKSYFTAVEGRKGMKMTFSLHPTQGKIDLFVKSCEKKENCQWNLDDVEKVLSGEIRKSMRPPIIQFSNVTDGDEVVSFEMDGSVCSPNSGGGFPRCYFAVGVLGTEENKTAKFTVIAKRDGLHQTLRANTPLREHLLLNQYGYYYFPVANDADVLAVSFQITKISGEVSVYISKTNRFPDKNDKDDNFYHFNDIYTFLKEDAASLNGTYYIAVKADTSATYSIVPIVTYDIDSLNLLELSEGVPQKAVLNSGQAAYFGFDVSFPENNSQTIEIRLNEVQGDFEICVNNNGEIPKQGKCQYTVNNTAILINPDQEGNLGIGTHFIGIFPRVISQDDSSDNKGDEDKKSSGKTHSFSITWGTLHYFVTLPYSVAFEGDVSASRVRYYKFEIHEDEDKEIIIYKNHLANYTVDLYLASQEVKLGSSVSVFNPDKTTKDSTSNAIKLNETDIQNLCVNSGSGFYTKCYFYLAVATNSTSVVPFTLTLTKDFDDLYLSESIETYYPFPSKQHPLHLFYYPNSVADVIVYARAPGREIVLYANVVDASDFSSRKEWKFPTNTSYDYIAKKSISNSEESTLNIEAGGLAFCGQNDRFTCAVAITLYYTTPNKTGSNINKVDFFSIIANQEITPISTGKVIRSSVNEGSYKYFRLYVPKEQATLLINVRAELGKPVFLFASQGKNARPTSSHAEFISYFTSLSSIQIAPSDTKTGSTQGDWVIAVFGPDSTDFTITVLYEQTKMIEISNGNAMNVDVKQDPIYLTYDHYSGQDLQLKLTKQGGNGIISVKRYLAGEFSASNLPTRTDETAQKLDSVQKVIDINKEEKCYFCLYVIGIFPDTEMKISFVLMSPGQWINLESSMIFTDYASNQIVNRYEYSAMPTQVVDINLIIYSGEPQVYVGHNPTVNQTNYLWSLASPSSKGYLRLRLNNTLYQNSSEIPSIWDGQRNVSSSIFNYYIIVKAPIPSNYSIAVSVSNTTRDLYDGMMDFGYLNSGEFNMYKYTPLSDAQNKEYRFKLQIILHRDQFSNALKEVIEKPNIILMTAKGGNITRNSVTGFPELPVLKAVREDISEKSYGEQNYIMNLQYTAPGGSPLVILVNNLNGKSHLNYSVIANSHEPILLSMNNLHSSRLEMNSQDVYAVQANSNGLLVAEVHECVGKVKVQFSRTKNLDGLIKGDESMLASSMGSYISLASIEITTAMTVYMIVTAIDGVRDDDVLPDIDAIYKIKTNLFPLNNFLPFMNLAPGHDGILDWNITDSGKLRFGFYDVRNLAYSDSIKSTKYGNLEIQYHYEFFLTKDASAGSFLSRCDMLPQSKGIYKNMDRFSKTFTFDKSNVTIDKENKDHKFVEFDPQVDFSELFTTMRITALGVSSDGHAVWDYPIIYQSTEVRNVTKMTANRFLMFLLIIVLAMLGLATSAVMYYYKKFKRVKQKLNFEMQDLRNLATTVESFDVLDDSVTQTRKGGYAGLIEEQV